MSPGISIPEAPGFSTWHRNIRERSWRTMNRSEMEQMRKALSLDMADCPGCVPGNIVSHATGYVSDREARTYQCRSNSRWFNPETRRMEGHSHCTCDYCF